MRNWKTPLLPCCVKGPLAEQSIKDNSIPRFDKPLPDDKSIAIEAKQLTTGF